MEPDLRKQSNKHWRGRLHQIYASEGRWPSSEGRCRMSAAPAIKAVASSLVRRNALARAVTVCKTAYPGMRVRTGADVAHANE